MAEKKKGTRLEGYPYDEKQKNTSPITILSSTGTT